MHWIYLSPHFDDAVLSCGGMIWEQTRSGETVEIWTICAGSPQRGVPLSEFALALQAEWKGGSRPIARRRAEDRAACLEVGALPRYWRLPDCIYRRLPNGEEVVSDNDDLWLPVHPGELDTVQRLRVWLRRALPREAAVVCPLSLGNHTDHRLVRAAAESLRRPLYYYADYPYVARRFFWMPPGLPEEQLHRVAVSAEGFRAWKAGAAAYSSQISSLFASLDDMYSQLEEFWQGGGGSCLWKPA
jgi:LmbE family N-acetylglucosaminyl deacetylase